MKIGIISDTHLISYSGQLDVIVEEHFANADVILHAGDIVDISILEVFRGKPLYAVCGNMDLPNVREVLPRKLILEIQGHRIGLIHGWGWGNPSDIEDRLLSQFDNIDCLVYGHTHHAVNKIRDSMVIFNPGSPTDRRFAPRNTIGILDIGTTIEGTIIELGT